MSGTLTEFWTAARIARAEEILTATQFAAFDLWTRGYGYRRIGEELGVSFERARDLVKRAVRLLVDDELKDQRVSEGGALEDDPPEDGSVLEEDGWPVASLTR